MAKYICSLCSYMYNEEREKLKFAELPDSWLCPLCGAKKEEFEQEGVAEETPKPATKVKTETKTQAKVEPKKNADKQLSNAEMNILCANLAKGCQKQYMDAEAALFSEIAQYYANNSQAAEESSYDAVLKKLNVDLEKHFPNSFATAKDDNDRGALRALTWTEKVSKIVKSLVVRYQKEGTKFLENTKIFVCEICGFIYLGDQAPDICPICKVPKLKIHEVGGM